MKRASLISSLILLLALGLHSGDGAKVLFFMGLASHSHRVALQPLGLKLADKGHEVTFLSHIKAEEPHPNITDFFPEPLRVILDQAREDWAAESVAGRLKQKHYDAFVTNGAMYEFSYEFQEFLARDGDFQEWIKGSKFDLIIFDSPLKELAVGIAYKMGAKIMTLVTTSTHLMHEFDLFGLPIESSWLPDLGHGGSQYPLIPDHFVWAYNSLKMYYTFTWSYLPKMDELLKELYGEALPSLDSLLRKIDLVLVNEHFSFSFPRALPPFVVPIGGMHAKEAVGALPEDLEAFIQSNNRFVFVSFGSALKISFLPPETLEMLFTTLGTFGDTNFLVKWDGEKPPENLAKNVIVRKWFPQTQVLAHPKCKGFITQGGAMSYHQAIFSGVPMIVVPLWGDQEYIARAAIYHEIGIWLELSEINHETLTKALREVLDTGKYTNNIKETSKRFKDRPLSAADTALWWTEYILRHDTAHLRSPGIEQYWWQRRLLDFWLCVLITLGVVLFLTCKALRLVIRVVLGSKSSSPKAKQS